jgi:flagellar biosynthesis/type III secretory pathway M-ring protein FliF/YscJ
MWDKIKKILKSIWTVIEYIAIAAFFGIAAIFLFRKPKVKNQETNNAEKAREDKKNELEEKTPDDIAADSPNPDTISTNIQREQEEFRKRVRDRLNKNIHRTGTSSNN